MNLSALGYFSLPEQTMLLSGILIRKVFGPNMGTIKLLDNKSLIEIVLDNGGAVTKDPAGVILTNRVGKSELKMLLRKTGADDIIYRDIILRNGGDYGFITGLAGHIGLDIRTIIDAGANIGTATGYLKSMYPQAKVVCIEPEPGNYALLEKNMALNGFDDVVLCQNAFWINNDELHIGVGVRGELAKELSFAIVDDSEVAVKGLTFKDCLALLGAEKVDLLKMDIEGAEAAFINDRAGFDYMIAHTRLLAIELHEEAVDIFRFHELIDSMDLKHIQRGETTFCWR